MKATNIKNEILITKSAKHSYSCISLCPNYSHRESQQLERYLQYLHMVAEKYFYSSKEFILLKIFMHESRLLHIQNGILI